MVVIIAFITIIVIRHRSLDRDGRWSARMDDASATTIQMTALLICTTDDITPEEVRKALGHLYHHSRTVKEWRRGCRDVVHQHLQLRLVNGADP